MGSTGGLGSASALARLCVVSGPEVAAAEQAQVDDGVPFGQFPDQEGEQPDDRHDGERHDLRRLEPVEIHPPISAASDHSTLRLAGYSCAVALMCVAC